MSPDQKLRDNDAAAIRAIRKLVARKKEKFTKLTSRVNWPEQFSYAEQEEEQYETGNW